MPAHERKQINIFEMTLAVYLGRAWIIELNVAMNLILTSAPELPLVAVVWNNSFHNEKCTKFRVLCVNHLVHTENIILTFNHQQRDNLGSSIGFIKNTCYCTLGVKRMAHIKRINQRNFAYVPHRSLTTINQNRFLESTRNCARNDVTT